MKGERRVKQQASGKQSNTRVPEKPGCGPSVDTWPILGAKGEEIAEAEEEEEEEEEEE
jgi:hypothetical protein